MLFNLTFNQLLIPLIAFCILAVVLVVFWGKVQAESLRQAQQKRLKSLNPPQKGRNHRSLPPRQYYLTRNMAKPTVEEEHLLEQYLKLYPDEARGTQRR